MPETWHSRSAIAERTQFLALVLIYVALEQRQQLIAGKEMVVLSCLVSHVRQKALQPSNLLTLLFLDAFSIADASSSGKLNR